MLAGSAGSRFAGMAIASEPAHPGVGNFSRFLQGQRIWIGLWLPWVLWEPISKLLHRSVGSSNCGTCRILVADPCTGHPGESSSAGT